VVIEAVFEDLSIKQAVLRDLEREAPNAIFASNTSSIRSACNREGATAPRQVVGMHFFSPVQRMPLLEVIRGRSTGAEAVARRSRWEEDRQDRDRGSTTVRLLPPRASSRPM